MYQRWNWSEFRDRTRPVIHLTRPNLTDRARDYYNTIIARSRSIDSMARGGHKTLGGLCNILLGALSKLYEDNELYIQNQV